MMIVVIKTVVNKRLVTERENPMSAVVESPRGGELRPWSNASDLRDYLDIATQTIYKWRVEGKGPRAHKIGGHLRFRREDVEKWLETQREAEG